MPGDQSHWLIDRLTAELDELPRVCWLIPLDRRSVPPPDGLGEWSAHRHLVHLATYEGKAVRPVISHLAEGLPIDPRYNGTPEQRSEIEAWENAPDLFEVLDEWRQARRAILDQLTAIPSEVWPAEVLHPAFGPLSLERYTIKIHQHTIHHLDRLLQMIFWWDFSVRPKLDYDKL